ncbi:MAG: 4Fe-4S binding protein [Pseudodesulfovibrio sp.]|uniref:4Fe-4S binding protein n=1 Tax=Pseudodesulfovibrio sp. TaxID=2035812 RepID=UPI003D106791
MKIEYEKCKACGLCIPFCPVGAIGKDGERVVIDQDECVECCLCLRNSKCPTEALYQEPLQMPRSIRKAFSDPLGKHENTDLGHLGRGTEEVKTNDVTGLVHGTEYIAMAVEPGRPLVGARFSDVEKIAMAIAPYVVSYDQNNPTTKLMVDQKKGLFDPSIRNEKVLSCILEFKLAAKDLDAIMKAFEKVGGEVDTVFSVGVIAATDERGDCPAEAVIRKRGVTFLDTSTKVNMGLGRPLFTA